MTRCLIGLGANLGDKRATLEHAVAQLSTQFVIHGVSSWRAYPAVGGPAGQDDFLNGVVLCETERSPQQVAATLHELERVAGRERRQRWAARRLDCDLLLYGNCLVDTPNLSVPHPRMITRRFVLQPAVEVAPEMVHPTTEWTIRELFEHLDQSPPYFAVVGSNREFTREVVAHVASMSSGQQLLLSASQADALNPMVVSASEPSEFARRCNELLSEVHLGREGAGNERLAVISDFWFWQPLLELGAAGRGDVEDLVEQMERYRPSLSPKLLMVTDPPDSPLGRVLRSLPRDIRVPILHLSVQRDDAMQDAAGAVTSMN